MDTGGFNAGGNPAMDWHPIQGGVEIFLVASCHGNRDKLRPDGPLGSYADFTYLLITAANKVTVNIENLSPSISLALTPYCRVKRSPKSSYANWQMGNITSVEQVLGSGNWST